MSNDKSIKQLKEEIGFIPPGVMVSKALGGNLQEIIASYHHEVWGDGVIPLKYRYFIALGTAIFDRNEKRAKLEIRKAIDNGATKEELFEVIKQQIWMRGAPELVQVAPLVKYIEESFSK